MARDNFENICWRYYELLEKRGCTSYILKNTRRSKLWQ
jgi:phage tail protein X